MLFLYQKITYLFVTYNYKLEPASLSQRNCKEIKTFSSSIISHQDFFSKQNAKRGYKRKRMSATFFLLQSESISQEALVQSKGRAQRRKGKAFQKTIKKNQKTSNLIISFPYAFIIPWTQAVFFFFLIDFLEKNNKM